MSDLNNTQQSLNPCCNGIYLIITNLGTKKASI